MITNYLPGNAANHMILPNEVTGYAFDPQDSWWSVIMPEGSTNMIVNPSFEAWTVTEYTATNWLAATYEEFQAVHATAGKRLAKLTMGSVEANLEYTGGLAVTTQPYSFSADVYAPYIGVTVTLQIRNGGTVLAQKVFTFRRAGWHRVSLSYVEKSTGTRQVRLVSTTVNPSGTVLYTDAWQFEAKYYATTYLDGDMIGNDDSIPNESYYWLGIAHRSMSVRRETTSSGGLLISWSEEAEFMTTAIVGLGMSPVESFTEIMADGAEVHRGSLARARPFTITGKIFAHDFPGLMQDHLSLVRLLRPNNTVSGEQMVLRYQYVNPTSRIEGRALDIVCAYNSGLEGSINGLYQETLALQFRASRPSMAVVFGSSAELLLYKELVTNNVIFKDEYGDYNNLGIGASSASPTQVGFLRDGSPVAFGPFTTLAGDVVAGSAYWDGVNWQQLGNLAGRSASDVIDGYVSGYPLTISTTTGDVSEYNETTDAWADLGIGFIGTIHSIARDPAGNIWVAGDFVDDGQAIPIVYNNVAKWNILTSAWEKLGAGLVDVLAVNPTLEVFTVLADDDGYVYFGGWFEEGKYGITTVGAHGAIRWNPVTEEWSGMGMGFNGAPNQFVRGSNGYIYAVGNFSMDGTGTTDMRGFARWNGYQWEEVFELIRVDGVTYGADGVEIDENGIFWFFAYVTDPAQDLFNIPTLGVVGTFGWKDGVFYPSIGSVSVTHMAIGPGNRTIYAVRAIDAEPTYKVPALNEVQYDGSADTFVALHIQGKCIPVQCINLSALGGIYFRGDLVIGENEEVVARSDTRRMLTYSHYRHNLKRFISSGPTSFRSLRLRPGINRISVFAHNIETISASAWLTWRDKYWGLTA